jgi:uncharacterized protein YkwD
MKRLLFILLMLFAMPRLKAQSTLPMSDRQFRDQFLYLINSQRAKGCNCGTGFMKPVPPLVWNDQLAKSAGGHAKDMYKRNYFSHDSENGRSMQDRIMKAGYNNKGYQQYAIGENIAFGQQTIEEVMAGWFKSNGHCKNLMNPDFKEIGIAEYHFYWVQDFGGRVSFAMR